MKKLLVVLAVLILVLPAVSFAHRSGCHRWHSCPSDTGSYVCGDLGYTSGCPNTLTPKATFNPVTATPVSAQGTHLNSLNAYMEGDAIKRDLLKFLLKNCKGNCDLTEVNNEKIRGIEITTGIDSYTMFSVNELMSAYYSFSLAVIDRLETSDNYPNLKSLEDTIVSVYGKEIRTITESYCQKHASKVGGLCVCDEGYTVKQTTGYIANGDVCLPNPTKATANKIPWYSKLFSWF